MCSKIGARDEASWQTSWLTCFGSVHCSEAQHRMKQRGAKKNTTGSQKVAKQKRKTQQGHKKLQNKQKNTTGSQKVAKKTKKNRAES